MALHQFAGVRDELEGAALAMEAKLVVIQIPFRGALRRLEPTQRQPLYAAHNTQLSKFICLGRVREGRAGGIVRVRGRVVSTWLTTLSAFGHLGRTTALFSVRRWTRSIGLGCRKRGKRLLPADRRRGGGNLGRVGTSLVGRRCGRCSVGVLPGVPYDRRAQLR